MAKTTKKPDRSKKSAKAPNNQSPLVWRIFHFKERFELPEDMRACRKSGLQYTRDFVSAAGGDEAVGYLNQFKLLDNGDGLAMAMLKGLYRDLVNMSAQHSKAKRGHLIDADDKPLTDVQIGKLLNIKGPTMRKILRQYAGVKLLEKVDMPEFDLSINDLPPRKGGDERGGEGRGKGDQRGSPEKSGNLQKPLKKRQNGKRENEKNNVNKQRATNGLTAVNAKGKENDNSAIHQANAQGEGSSRGQVKDEPPTAPATAPPLPSEPHVSDDLGDSHVIPFTCPQTSFEPASRSQHPAVTTVAGGYNRGDEVVGDRVYAALGLRWAADSPEGRREICSFASKWAQCRVRLARLPPDVVDGLGVRLIVEARKIAKRGKRNKRPGAVWCTVADKLAAARLKEAM